MTAQRHRRHLEPTEDRSDRIERDGPELMWLQVADDIAADIASGRLRTRAKLPGEVRLAKVYGVSRPTVVRVMTTRASGVTFMNLEDETGMIDVVVSTGLFLRTSRAVRSSSALLVRGNIERAEGVVSLVADRLEVLRPRMDPAKSHDFR